MSSDLSELEIAGGTVAGRAHLLTGRNNQDAFAWTRSPGGLVAVVADGCGSGRHSELGAKLGASALSKLLLRRLDEGHAVTDSDFWRGASDELLALLGSWADAVSNDRSKALAEAFLFTLVGLVITPETTSFFSVGDGLAVINDQAHRLGPFPNNAPPYFTYALMSGIPQDRRTELAPTVRLATRELHYAVLGTDGADDLGGEGVLRSFKEDDLCFQNSDAVRRRLTRHNRQRTQRGEAPLPDDTTLVVIRRRPRHARGDA